MGNMDRYMGKVCPYCKTPFKEDDDIVICSACEMPHHKECWIENKGCTTFGCLGTIKAADADPADGETVLLPTEEPSVNRFCPRCGAPIAAGNAFCGSCGSPASPSAPVPVPQPQQTAYQPVYQQIPPQQTQYQQNTYSYTAGQQQSQYQQPVTQPQQQYYGGGAYTGGDRERLIGNNAQYYMQKFSQIKSQGSTVSWNWCAFLVSPFWMLYRKMYGYGAGLLGAAVLLALCNAALIMIVPYILIGMFGNYLYMQQIEKHENQLRMLAEPEKTQYIQTNSSTSTNAVVIGVVVYIFVCIIIL